MRRFRISFPMVFAIAMSILFGCSADTDTGRSVSAKQEQSDSQEATTEARQSAKKKSASLVLGESAFNLDLVMCIGTSMATVVASDSQKRPDNPVLTVKTYDPAMTGGQSFNTVSVVFERNGYGEHWVLHEGTVSKDGKVFAAAGTLEGSRLMPKNDGTRESMPLENMNILPFEIRIEC